MRTIVVAMALLAVMVGAVAAEDGVRLLYKFEPGQKFEYEMTLAGSGVTTVTPEGAEGPQATVPMEMVGTMAMTQQVVQMYDDGSALLDAIVSGLEMDMTVQESGESKKMHMKFTPDSLVVTGPDGTQELNLSEAGMQMTPIGTPMQLRMTPRGEVLAMSTEGMEQLSAMTGMDFSQMMKAGETPFPDRGLSPGESWSYEMEFPLPGADQPVELEMEAKLLRLEGDVATVGIAGDIDLSGMTMEVPSGPSEGTKLTFDTLTETLSGEFDFDVARGAMTEAAYDIELVTAMVAPSKEGQPPSKIRTEMNMKIGMNLK